MIKKKLLNIQALASQSLGFLALAFCLVAHFGLASSLSAEAAEEGGAEDESLLDLAGDPFAEEPAGFQSPALFSGLDLQDYFACLLVKKFDDKLFGKMSPGPLFASDGDACRPVDGGRVPEGRVFTDAECAGGFEYGGRQSILKFCLENMIDSERSRQQIGSPPAWLDEGRSETDWTLSPGTRLLASVLDQTEANRQPFLKRVEYRTVDGCSLGMHIYSADPAAADLEPVMVLHGGGWRLRGLAAIAGIETIAPNLTEQGYLVFAPFHRLLEDRDGPNACRNAKGEDILEDVRAAHQWILDNGSRYGMRETRQVSLVGQSSGAHLAAYLSVELASEVDRVMLLYPPADFGFFLENARSGGRYAEAFAAGLERLESFIGRSVEGLSQDVRATEVVTQNSLPPRINTAPDDFPKYFLIHGTADQTVPVEMSTRFCEALDPKQKPDDRLFDRSQDALRRSCGENGELRLVEGADHLLDLRCFTGDLSILTRYLDENLGLCQAGSASAAKEVRGILEEGYRHLGAGRD